LKIFGRSIVPDASAPDSSGRTADIVMFVLGLLWIVDGILQLQPASFTSAFANEILAPNINGQPALLSSVVSSGVQLFSASPWAANMAAAIIQISIGLALVLPLRRRLKVVALYSSIAWAVVVWVLGEGMGSIFTGNASFYTGAPGSVVLYLVLAVFLLYPNRLPAKRLPSVAGALFLFGAALQLLPAFWSADGVQSLFSLASADSIDAIAAPANALANIALQAPLVSNAMLALLLAIFGLLLIVRPNRVVAIGSGAFLILVWWLGQDFGGILTFPSSTATDPNSAVVFLLFLVPLYVGSGTRGWPLGASPPSATP
jgi:hypothetical protein